LFGLTSASDQTRRFDRLPIASGLHPGADMIIAAAALAAQSDVPQQPRQIDPSSIF